MTHKPVTSKFTSYYVYFTNHGYFSDNDFNTEKEAIDYGKMAGMEFQVYKKVTETTEELMGFGSGVTLQYHKNKKF